MLQHKTKNSKFKTEFTTTNENEISKKFPAQYSPIGFLASGVFCDIKRLGTGKGSNKGPKRDLALIVSEIPATVAGMFTTNQVCAAPVKVCVARMKRGVAQAWSSIPATPTPALANKE